MTLKMWYKEGLNFSCTGCGKCCTGAPGYAFVSPDEIQTMAEHLKLSLDEFGEKYLRKVGNKYALLENPLNYDCVFLEGNKCQIYEVRPLQCRTFPWWPGNLKDKSAWEKAALSCEGINREAPVVPFETIEAEKNSQLRYEEEDLC